MIDLKAIEEDVQTLEILSSIKDGKAVAFAPEGSKVGSSAKPPAAVEVEPIDVDPVPPAEPTAAPFIGDHPIPSANGVVAPNPVEETF